MGSDPFTEVFDHKIRLVSITDQPVVFEEFFYKSRI